MLERLEKRNILFKLLKDINVSDDEINNYFEQAIVDKVEVCKKDKTWTLFFASNKIIPFKMFNKVREGIINKFNDIANIIIKLKFEDISMADFLEEYWQELINEYSSMPSIYNSLKDCKQKFDNYNLILYVQNKASIDIFNNKNIHIELERKIIEYTDNKVNINFKLAEDSDSMSKFKEELEKENINYIKELVQTTTTKKKDIEENLDNLIFYGRQIYIEPTPIKNIFEEERNVVIQGKVFSYDCLELKSGRNLIMFNITDYTDSIQVKLFVRDVKKDLPILKKIEKGKWLKLKGDVQFDTFSKELIVMATDINEIEPRKRMDKAEEKRIELHLHTNMSAMDGITSIKDYVKQAHEWGHNAIAVTDHGVVQAFPDAYEASTKYDIKVIYGVEANVIDDGVPIVYNQQSRDLNSETYVIFDTETTGLSAVYNTIIEIGAVKIKDGEIIDRFETFVDPQEEISAKITEITGINNQMVKGAPLLKEALPKFIDFIGDATLVAHNARFDINFINIGLKNLNLSEINNPVIDTVELARFLYPNMKNYKLNTLCKALNIELVNHHRALNDAEATGNLFWKMVIDTIKRGINNIIDINRNVGTIDINKLRPFHMTILVKDYTGLKNLYKIVTASHIEYFYRNPRIPRSYLSEHKEGLLFGTACHQGELFNALLSKTPEEIEQIAKFYDYIEVQPIKNYQHLIDNGILQTQEEIKGLIKKMVDLGEKLNISVVASGDVHHLEEKEEINRRILNYNQISGFRYHRDNEIVSSHFLTTNEMLEEFSFLGGHIANKIVVENPNNIVKNIEQLKPFPDDLYTPVIEGADEEIRTMSYNTARQIYGDPLPEIVEKRLEKELNSIISHGYSVIYLISHKLVNKSLEDGYLVGSRGSVGSSFVATMTKITEVNPLPPHYVCPKCQYSQFITDGSIGSGFDLPDLNCPNCNTKMKKDGHDIPFETFMGFKGDKVPDIDLNFSGEYQPTVHKYTEELFGPEYVYRAGTISTVAEKTAYGYVKKYVEENELNIRNAEISRLVDGCTGIKRTTGQHPGGLMVIPQYKDVHDFTPIQRPADDRFSETVTTHFDYHAISGRLLKLDILGHDDPTAIKMLQDLTGINPKDIPVDDPKVYQLFRNTESLGITSEDINDITSGSLGLPEFGTKFVRQMLDDTNPTTFAELVRISGLSHGTDVWLNNAQDIIKDGKAVLTEVISTRDDIMVYLIQKELEPSIAFKLTEKVRKGKGLQEEDIEEMKKHDVPDWYIESCQRIKYMFPKAHAVAYVLMAIRIAYFKVYYPIYYYATYFSVRADEFDVNIMVNGANAIKKKINEIGEKGVTASPKEKNLLTVLELALEMVARGFSFQNVDINKSDATKFIIGDDKISLIPPFSAISGIGENAAKNIVKAKGDGEILSLEDFQVKAKASKTTIELLQQHGCLKDLPETNQLSLF